MWKPRPGQSGQREGLGVVYAPPSHSSAQAPPVSEGRSQADTGGREGKVSSWMNTEESWSYKRVLAQSTSVSA